MSDEAQPTLEQIKNALGNDGIFLLIASTWLHDIGLIPTREEIEQIRNCKSEVRWETEKKLYQDISYSHYNVRFEQKFNELTKMYEKEMKPITQYDTLLIKIAKNHKHDNYDLYNKYIRKHNIKEKTHETWREEYLDDHGKEEADPLIYAYILAAYLRLAETIAMPNSRENSKDPIKAYMTTGLDEFSMLQWIKTNFGFKDNNNPKINHKKHRITIEIWSPENIKSNDNEFNNVNILNRKIEHEIQDQLDLIHEILIDGGISCFLDVKCKISEDRFMNEPDSDQFRQLLTSLPLFEFYSAPNSTAITSAVRSQLKTMTNENNKAIIDDLNKFNTYVLETLSNERPCHVFLDTIRSFIDERIKDLNQAGSEGKQKSIIDGIKNKLEEWNKTDESIENNLPDMAYGLLSGREPILLYGLSGSIIQCIKGAIEEDEIEKKNPDIKNTRYLYMSMHDKNNVSIWK